MLELSQLLLFLITSLVIIMAPGQDMLLIMTRSIALGRRAGVATAAGVSVGLVGHTVLAALGLGAVLETSELLFHAIKYAGAAYLIYLGVRSFRATPIGFAETETPHRPLGELFVQGAASNLANPKIVIFYFAFLPQFVSPGATHPTAALALYGILFAALTFAVKAPIGYLAGSLSNWLRRRQTVQRWLNRASGLVLIGLGLRLAFAGRDN